MCGRAKLEGDVSEIKIAFRVPPEYPTPNFPPSWNVAPTDSLPVVRYDTKAGERSLDLLRWGLVPFWAKDLNVGFGATVAGLMGIGPRDELEGMIAAQLMAAHNAAMECYRRAMVGEQTFEGRRENLSQANKLSRTYALLLDALNRAAPRLLRS